MSGAPQKVLLSSKLRACSFRVDDTGTVFVVATPHVNWMEMTQAHTYSPVYSMFQWRWGRDAGLIEIATAEAPEVGDEDMLFNAFDGGAYVVTVQGDASMWLLYPESCLIPRCHPLERYEYYNSGGSFMRLSGNSSCLATVCPLKTVQAFRPGEWAAPSLSVQLEGPKGSNVCSVAVSRDGTRIFAVFVVRTPPKSAIVAQALDAATGRVIARSPPLPAVVRPHPAETPEYDRVTQVQVRGTTLSRDDAWLTVTVALVEGVRFPRAEALYFLPAGSLSTWTLVPRPSFVPAQDQCWPPLHVCWVRDAVLVTSHNHLRALQPTIHLIAWPKESRGSGRSPQLRRLQPTPELRHVARLEVPEGEGAIEDLKASPNGRWLLAAGSRQILVWDVNHLIARARAVRWAMVLLRQLRTEGRAAPAESVAGADSALARATLLPNAPFRNLLEYL